MEYVRTFVTIFHHFLVLTRIYIYLLVFIMFGLEIDNLSSVSKTYVMYICEKSSINPKHICNVVLNHKFYVHILWSEFDDKTF
jgi:hypothetical protein